MGRKGVSKRKSSQTKSKPFTGAGNSGVATALQATETQPAKSAGKPGADRKKAPKKG